MKILIVNSFDIGGAANACLRLHTGLLNKNVDSKILLKEKFKDYDKTYQISITALQRKLIDKILNKSVNILKELNLYRAKPNKFISKRDFGLEMYSFPNSDYDITSSPLYKEADVVNLHWVADFLDYTTFFKKNTKPVVWTLHDMNPFTGGEHYNEVYCGIDNQGYPIPRVISDNEKKIFKEVLEIKKASLEGCNNLHIVSLCSWMTKEVKKSHLFSGFPVYQIPNGIDKDVFNIRNMKFSRQLLDIPIDKKVILFVADAVFNKRKGFAFLQDALIKLENKDFILVAVGKINKELKSIENVITLGAIVDEKLMSIVYSAADVFVIPSLMDNLPNTVLESIMCGTPVIGFPIGGIPDMITHGKNGYLTKKVSSSALANTIAEFLEDPDVFDRKEIRMNAEKKYALSVQAEAYTNLFKQIL
jgi:glycosyltransferase involved in cell wall biosynthesis